MAIGRARAVDLPAGALMYSYGFLNVSEIIASNWSLKSRDAASRGFLLGRLEGS